MQPAVITASLAGLQVLEAFGIAAAAATGHSLGEITSLHWAGAFDAETLLRLARVRGAAMADLGSPTGAMFALAAPWQEVLPLLNGEPLNIVGYNSPRQTVVAGEAAAGKNLARRAAARGWQVSQLPVSHAFHTQLVAAAVPVLAGQLAREAFSALERRVYSTVTGALLQGNEDLRELLCRQVTSPVRFETALTALLDDVSDAKSGARRNESRSPGFADRGRSRRGVEPSGPRDGGGSGGRLGSRREFADWFVASRRRGFCLGRASENRRAVCRPLHPSVRAGLAAKVFREPVRVSTSVRNVGAPGHRPGPKLNLDPNRNPPGPRRQLPSN